MINYDVHMSTVHDVLSFISSIMFGLATTLSLADHFCKKNSNDDCQVAPARGSASCCSKRHSLATALPTPSPPPPASGTLHTFMLLIAAKLNLFLFRLLFGIRVFMGISGDNSYQIPNPRLLLKMCLILEYWTSLISVYPHFSLSFSVFFSIPNTLPLPSGLCGLWVGFCGNWVKIKVSPNTLRNYSH
jgi:hypothetical protein